jgi:hypothetical protein
MLCLFNLLFLLFVIHKVLGLVPEQLAKPVARCTDYDYGRCADPEYAADFRFDIAETRFHLSESVGAIDMCCCYLSSECAEHTFDATYRPDKCGCVIIHFI